MGNLTRKACEGTVLETFRMEDEILVDNNLGLPSKTIIF
jgi:hypothetical protein